jgi:hypothetical protein
MRRALQIFLQRSKRVPALRADLGKLRLDVGTHDGNYFVFVQTLSSSPLGTVNHHITGRGANLWADGPASQAKQPVRGIR